MNVHFVLLFKRVDSASLIRAAVNSVGYRLNADDRVYIYTNLCLDARDISMLRSDLCCDIYLQPLPHDSHAALSILPDIVTGKAKDYPNDANLLIDAYGKFKRSRTMIIPSIASTLQA